MVDHRAVPLPSYESVADALNGCMKCSHSVRRTGGTQTTMDESRMRRSLDGALAYFAWPGPESESPPIWKATRWMFESMRRCLATNGLGHR